MSSLPSLASKLSRGLTRILRGETPHFLVALNERKREAAWKRFLDSGSEYYECRIEGGAILKLHRNDSLARGIACGNFERGERRLVSGLLRKGDCFIDVGADLGLYTVLAGKKVGQAGRVISVEPSPVTCRGLRRQIELNGLENVTVAEAGLSSSTGELELWDAAAGGDAFSSFGKPIQEGGFEKVKVAVTTLDLLAEEFCGGRMPSLVKIDVEGWEPNVLRGGQSLLSRPDSPKLLVEFCEDALRGAGSSCVELHAILRDYGYSLRIVDHYSGKLRDWTEPGPVKYENVLAEKRS